MRSAPHLSVETRHISLDLPAEPCNNYPVQAGQFGGVSPLAEVRLQEGESLENALRRFKRKVQQEDIIKEVKRHSFYLKPGRKEAREGSLGAQTQPEKSSERAGVIL